MMGVPTGGDMRAPLIRLGCLLSLLIPSSTSAVAMDWTPIGNPGNACDPQPLGCLGAVSYAYNIGTYEVTNAQYAEFLNAKAVSDTLFLYNASMGSDAGGITRTGTSGSYSYNVTAGRESWPVNYISFLDAVRFANWMNNGQGGADTETGAYTLLGGAIPTNRFTVTRNVGATILLPTEDEWHKAAYYSPSGVYYEHAAGSDLAVTCAAPTAAANHANCGNAVGGPTEVGSYTGSTSPYGTSDQAGNVWEVTELINPELTSQRVIRGGAFNSSTFFIGASSLRPPADTDFEDASRGFRLVMIPEPGTGLLVIAGMLGLAGWRRTRA
jgi:formylglycine-generating enzyme required for sulfatase activity